MADDFNCTLDSTVDRTSEEPTPQSSEPLNCLVTLLDLFDTWRVKQSDSTVHMGEGQQ